MGRSRSPSRSRSSRRRSSSRSRRRKHRYRSSERSHRSSRRRSRYSRSSSRSSRSSRSDRRSSRSSSSRSPSRSPVRNLKTSSSSAPAMSKIKLQKTPSPPPAPTFSSAMNYLDERQVTDALDEINADEFVPKTFKTETSAKPKPDAPGAASVIKNFSAVPSEDPLFHQNFYIDEDERMERWIKKLLNYRQKQFASAK